MRQHVQLRKSQNMHCSCCCELGNIWFSRAKTDKFTGQWRRKLPANTQRSTSRLVNAILLQSTRLVFAMLSSATICTISQLFARLFLSRYTAGTIVAFYHHEFPFHVQKATCSVLNTQPSCFSFWMSWWTSLLRWESQETGSSLVWWYLHPQSSRETRDPLQKASAAISHPSMAFLLLYGARVVCFYGGEVGVRIESAVDVVGRVVGLQIC